METNPSYVSPQLLLHQATSHILMVRPAAFRFNEQTALSNAFMIRDKSHSPSSISELAREEFDEMVSRLRAQGITVTVFEDLPTSDTPDAVFPNNWVSTHQQGKIFLYPMHAPNRRLERRKDIVDWIASLYPQVVIYDLSPAELEGRYLEGTGSMVLDRVNQIAYANVSPRTDLQLLEDFCKKSEVECQAFRAVDEAGTDIYHTNVMMALGATFAVICLECIPEEADRVRISQRLIETGHEIIPITYSQVHAFAGNMLQVYNQALSPFTVMSQRAYDSLREDQVAALMRHGGLIVVALDVIEVCGGGSVRCMMAELFHPANDLKGGLEFGS